MCPNIKKIRSTHVSKLFLQWLVISLKGNKSLKVNYFLKIEIIFANVIWGTGQFLFSRIENSCTDSIDTFLMLMNVWMVLIRTSVVWNKGQLSIWNIDKKVAFRAKKVAKLIVLFNKVNVARSIAANPAEISTYFK